MKNIKFLTVVCLFSIMGIQAQSILPGQLGGTRDNGLISTSPVVINENVEGTPYINEKYLPASISASEDDVFYVRYNAMRDQFEVKGEYSNAYYLNRYRRDIKIEILPLGKIYQVQGYLDEDENENFGYFVYLTDQNAPNILFKKEKVSFINEKLAYTSYDTAHDARYKRWRDAYFIQLDGERLLTELPSSKKGLGKLFPGKEKQIASYIKENKLKLRKEEDLKQIINYVNSI